MNKTAKIIIALLVVLVIAGGAVLLSNKKKNESSVKESAGTSTGTNNTSSSDTSGNGGEVAVTITYNGSGFELSKNTVKAGEKVKVVNSSQNDLDFDSDPHPVHTDNPELNAGDIPAGQSKTFTLTTKGPWGFHNHLNSSQHGEITVE